MREKFAILRYFDDAFSKTAEWAKNSKPRRGETHLRLVYNMGYVIKTPALTFAIDLCHPRAAEIAGSLDFLLITHNHQDHICQPLISALKKAGKPVVQNYMDTSDGFLPAIATNDGNITWRDRLAINYGIEADDGETRCVRMAEAGFYCKTNSALHPQKGKILNYGMNDRVIWYQTEFAKATRFKYPSRLCLASDGNYTDVGWGSWYDNHINETSLCIYSVHNTGNSAQILYLDGHAALTMRGDIPGNRMTPFWWGQDEK